MDAFMNRALSLASLGLKRTSPNPMVGCVIVKDGRVIGEGWHHEYGHPHAEIEAINDAQSRNEDIKGSTFFVTLEPCSHYGKTPPCAERLVREGVKEVVIAMKDPNPKVNGRGVEILRNAGIKVSVLYEFESAAKFLNRGFIFAQKYHRPFITLKAAMSLDGRMCLNNGSSKWLTGIESRTKAHLIRAENDAVLVGAGTILTDDPELTVRHVNGINPRRIILDTKLSTPLNAKVIGKDEKCYIFTCERADGEKAKALAGMGAKIIALPEKNNHVEIKSVLEELVKLGVLTLMIEGGAEVIGAFLREGYADCARLFFAPRILGEGKGFNVGLNFDSVEDSFAFDDVRVKMLGRDIFVEGRFKCSPDL